MTICGGSKNGWDGTGEVWVLADTGITVAPSLSIWTAVELDWNTRTGRTYRVDWMTSLVTSNWVTLTNVVGNGTTNVVFDSARGVFQRYYRIVE